MFFLVYFSNKRRAKDESFQGVKENTADYNHYFNSLEQTVKIHQSFPTSPDLSEFLGGLLIKMKQSLSPKIRKILARNSG